MACLSYLVNPLSAEVLCVVLVVKACTQEISERSQGPLQSIRNSLFLGLCESDKVIWQCPVSSAFQLCIPEVAADPERVKDAVPFQTMRLCSSGSRLIHIPYPINDQK